MKKPESEHLDEAQETPAEGGPDRASRASAVKNAIAMTAMEGGRPSAYCRELLALFEAGEISANEMRHRMIRKARE